MTYNFRTKKGLLRKKTLPLIKKTNDWLNPDTSNYRQPIK